MPPQNTLTTREPQIMTLLKHPNMQKQIGSALPRAIGPDRFARMALTMLRQTPKLAECEVETVLGALFESAQLGLEPNTPLGQAYILPYGRTAQLIIGYKGMIALASRAGITLDAHVVYTGDDFDYQLGLQKKLNHRPCDDPEKRGDMTHAYAIAEWADGRQMARVINRADIEATKQRSAAVKYGKKDSPWFTDPASMWAKTAIRRLASFLPMAAELVRAAAIDEANDLGDFSRVPFDITEIPESPENTADRLSAGLADTKGDNPPPPPPSQQAQNQPAQSGAGK